MNSMAIKNSKLLIYIVSSFSILLWGISYIWTNQLIEMNIPIYYFVFFRTFLAGIILFLLNASRGYIRKIKKTDIPKFLLLSFFEPFLYFLCETSGVKATGSPSLSAMIIATIPIFSIFAGRIFFKEKISGINITGILLSLSGIFLVVLSKDTLEEHYLIGVIFLFIAVISEVGHAIITKKLSDIYSSQVIVMYQFLIGSVYLFPFMLGLGLDNFDAKYYFSAEVMYPIICLSILCSSIAFTLWISTIKSLGIAKSSIFLALIPIVASIAAWILGKETLTYRQVIGIFISTIGVIISQLQLKKERISS